MKLTFHGAARSVTGSRHLLEVGGKRILLDCGLVQGRRAEADLRNRQMGFAARDVDAVILSHAHIDHSGALPAIVKHGFGGPVHATAATADLCDVMLRDSAHIQQRDLETVNRRERRHDFKPKEPLYSLEDAAEAVRRIVPRKYGEAFEVAEGVTATFLDAGHILGSAIVRLDLQERGVRRTLVFSGDLGRDCLPIIRNPERIEAADHLVLETTYGNRGHEPIEDLEHQIVALVKRVLDRKGKIIIPAFAVGRTQHIVYVLNNLANRKLIPHVPVFVDSPLARETTEVFRRHPECWDPEMVRLLREQHDADPFGFSMLRYLRTPDESRTLNDFDGSAIIISASGMCESGRILHHLANHLPSARNVLLIVGYQAEGTLGRRLLEGAKHVAILGRPVEVRAEVVKMNALSAHAGRPDLEKVVLGVRSSLKHLHLVHGEPPQMDPFAEWARGAVPAEVHAPGLGASLDL